MAQGLKDPFTRLLDLTLGWGEYIEKTEDDYGDSVTAEEIYAVYQSVAEFAEPYWDAPAETQERVLRAFVETRLMPLLLNRQRPEITGDVSHEPADERQVIAANKVAA